MVCAGRYGVRAVYRGERVAAGHPIYVNGDSADPVCVDADTDNSACCIAVQAEGEGERGDRSGDQCGGSLPVFYLRERVGEIGSGRGVERVENGQF